MSLGDPYRVWQSFGMETILISGTAKRRQTPGIVPTPGRPANKSKTSSSFWQPKDARRVGCRNVDVQACGGHPGLAE
ncbi:hypothetical protein KC340_g56 [Hortaea werneckii]|nr:hypothetical protein KC340_g56 [Hortaea werneckii]